jgi:hypothetical protein
MQSQKAPEIVIMHRCKLTDVNAPSVFLDAYDGSYLSIKYDRSNIQPIKIYIHFRIQPKTIYPRNMLDQIFSCVESCFFKETSVLNLIEMSCQTSHSSPTYMNVAFITKVARNFFGMKSSGF